jgi:hypothetical protein
VREISLLFAVQAREGSLIPVKGSSRRFALTLRGVAPQASWFQERPTRATGQLMVRGIADAWAGLGFAGRAPAAALSLLDGKVDADTMVVKLTRPRYVKRRRMLRFKARRAGRPAGPLAHYRRVNDRALPRHFKHAALYVADVEAPVVNGCVIQPYTICPYADLAGADLTGAYLQSALLERANLSGANLTEAHLRDATLSFANLRSATLTSADAGSATFAGAYLDLANASRAYLQRAYFSSASMQSIDLSRANLSSSNLSYADLSRSNLSYASLRGANMTGTATNDAIFCQTALPNGDIRNSGC